MTTTHPTPQLRLYFDTATGAPSWGELTMRFPHKADAAAWLATVPKALGLKAPGGDTVRGRLILTPNDANGGVNEAGVKRLRRWLADLPVEYVVARAINAYPDLATAMAAIDGAMA